MFNARTVWGTVLCILVSACCLTEAATSPPNIVFIVADDFGWNDVGFHNPNVITPNIDKLAQEGIVLNQAYVQPVCTPSRSAFLSGVYPFRLGLQHLVIMPQQAVCLPLNRTLLPQQLKAQGYMTHAVGKWHLGFCNWKCTPTYRGFDSFYGYYNGQVDYYNKTILNGYDFRDNKTLIKDVVGEYSTYQYADRIKKIISDHDSKKPLFLYLPFQNIHAPLEVPQKYLDMYEHITDKDRKTALGMVTAMDDAIGTMVTALKSKGLYDNTLIAFSADNGGWTQFGGNNYPLRGGKVTVFEGGTRAISFVHGPMFNTTGTKYEGLMHAVDWFPTLAEAAGLERSYADIDGVSQWQSFLNLSRPSPRQEVVYNYDPSRLPLQGKAAIRIGDYKLIEGFPGIYPNWYKPAGEQGILRDSSGQSHPFLTSTGDFNLSTTFNFFTQYPEALERKLLFNLKDDPNEHKDLYRSLPEVAKQLESRLDYHKSRVVEPNFPQNAPEGSPDKWGGNWAPGWC